MAGTLAVPAFVFGDAATTPALLHRQGPPAIGSTFALHGFRRDRDETGERDVCKNADHQIGERACLHALLYRNVPRRTLAFRVRSAPRCALHVGDLRVDREPRVDRVRRPNIVHHDVAVDAVGCTLCARPHRLRSRAAGRGGRRGHAPARGLSEAGGRSGRRSILHERRLPVGAARTRVVRWASPRRGLGLAQRKTVNPARTGSKQR